MAEEEVVQIAALHLLDEAKDWWFGHLEHAKVTNFSYFFHKLRKNFDVEKTDMCYYSPIILNKLAIILC